MHLSSRKHGDQEARPTRRRTASPLSIGLLLAVSAACCVSLRGGWNFIAPEIVGGASRRSLLTGLIGLLPAAIPTEQAIAARGSGATYDEIRNPCSCCQFDWCATKCTILTSELTYVTSDCDCYDFISGLQASRRQEIGGFTYKTPLSHNRARQLSVKAGKGEEEWAGYLKWNSADMKKWYPADYKSLEIKPSTTFAEAGDGLFAKDKLKKWSVLPPYRGKPLSVADLKRMKGTKDMDYVYCPSRDAGILNLTASDMDQVIEESPATTFCVDGRTESRNNPTKYINSVKSKADCDKVNVKICEFGDVAYFRTMKIVNPGQELIADYGGAYWEDFDGCPDV